MDITKLPFNEMIGLQRSDRDEYLFRLPGEKQYTNHLGTVHASALMALAEATSGEFLSQALADRLSTSIPVVRRFDCKFRKPAIGEVSSSASVSEGALESVTQSLDSKGRASVSVVVSLFDDSGVQVMTATVDWFIASQE